MRYKWLVGLSAALGLLYLLFQNMKSRKIVSTDQTKPQRNNNPFAIIQSKPSNWRGLAKDTGAFLKFDSARWGVRAGYINLVNTYLKRNLNTIAKIFPVYAPASDGNKPEKYIEFVEKFTGINRNESITDTEQLYAIGRAIERVEAGKSWVDANEWDQGWTDALSVINPALRALQFTSGVKKAAAMAKTTPLNPFFIQNLLKNKND